MPAERKPLPRPCPLCCRENGSIRITIYNPKYSYTPNDKERIILCIGHYNPELYRLSKKRESKFTGREWKPGKVWHNFKIQLSKAYGNRYCFGNNDRRKSKSFPLPLSLFNKFKKEGYPIIFKRAHFLKKGGLTKCDLCENLVKITQVLKWRCYSLCNSCYKVRTA